ncbi:hypothetical protein DVW08_08835 [Clostridium botulinum]|nr:hypothetical protein [Clostridium botulinum]
MNLGKIKELEDAKKEAQEYGSIYNSLFKKKKHNYIVNAYNDFKVFFKEKGFTIQENDYELEAIYGESKIRITIPNEEDCYIGAYSVWKLQCSIDKSKYRILLNELHHYPTIRTSIGVSSTLSEEEKINRELNKIKEKIQETKNNIDKFDDVKFGYGLINENEQNTNSKYPQFESMKELLENIFK